MGQSCSGMEESKVSSSSRKSQSCLGGQYTTTMRILTGAVTKMAWYSKVLYLAMGSSWFYFHLLEISIPVPPPRPYVRELWENVWLVDSAAGVGLSSCLIQVSVRARMSSDRWLA